jgi:hypothetical protein
VSAETDMRAALAAHAPLTALVGTCLALNVAPQGMQPPLVVYASKHDPQRGLDGALQVDLVMFEVQCWARTADAAAEVADAVEAALAVYDGTQPGKCITVIDRGNAYDPETNQNSEQLTVEWWQQ